MTAMKELEKAFSHATSGFNFSKFDKEISAQMIRNSMKAYADRHSLSFSNEEIEAFIAERIEDPKESSAPLHMEDQLSQSFGIAIHNIIAGQYDDIARQEVISGMKAYAKGNGYDLSDEDIEKYVDARFHEFSHVADLTPYK